MKKCNIKKFSRLLSMFLLMTLLILGSLNTVSCTNATPQVQAGNLMDGVKPNEVNGHKTDDKFIGNLADFNVDLFKQTVDLQKNSLVSPISVMLALAMTANGAEKDTLTEMEKVLGNDIPLEDLNEYLYYYVKNLPSGDKTKLQIANSIWFRDDEDRLTVEKDFLQKNGDYYNADIFKTPFTNKTLEDINKWVQQNTDNLIDKILDDINPDAVMYLLNSIVFDAEWKSVYNKEDIHEQEFTTLEGTKQKSDFMRSEEDQYVDDGKATGFLKPYFNDEYSFLALLPNEGVSLEEYIDGLSGEGLLNTIKNAEPSVVYTTTPKFSYEYEIELNDTLKDMGMPQGFDSSVANFSRMGKSSRGNIYIGEVLHKTFISLDELGTKAGAVTKVEMRDESAPADPKIVVLDRPFVYAIIDNSTNLPVFMGTVMDLEK